MTDSLSQPTYWHSDVHVVKEALSLSHDYVYGHVPPIVLRAVVGLLARHERELEAAYKRGRTAGISEGEGEER